MSGAFSVSLKAINTPLNLHTNKCPDFLLPSSQRCQGSFPWFCASSQIPSAPLYQSPLSNFQGCRVSPTTLLQRLQVPPLAYIHSCEIHPRTSRHIKSLPHTTSTVYKLLPSTPREQLRTPSSLPLSIQSCPSLVLYDFCPNLKGLSLSDTRKSHLHLDLVWCNQQYYIKSSVTQTMSLWLIILTL